MSRVRQRHLVLAGGGASVLWDSLGLLCSPALRASCPAEAAYLSFHVTDWTCHTAYLSFHVTDWRSELVFPQFQIPERKLWVTWLVDLPHPISSDWGWAVVEKTGLASLSGWAGSFLRGSVALGQADVQHPSPVVRLQQISSGRSAFGPLNSPASSQCGSQLRMREETTSSS